MKKVILMLAVFCSALFLGSVIHSQEYISDEKNVNDMEEITRDYFDILFQGMSREQIKEKWTNHLEKCSPAKPKKS